MSKLANIRRLIASSEETFSFFEWLGGLRKADSGRVVLEIAYQPEPALTGNRITRILHYHHYDEDLKHGTAKELSKHSEIYEKYKKYLEA